MSVQRDLKQIHDLLDHPISLTLKQGPPISVTPRKIVAELELAVHALMMQKHPELKQLGLKCETSLRGSTVTNHLLSEQLPSTDLDFVLKVLYTPQKGESWNPEELNEFMRIALLNAFISIVETSPSQRLDLQVEANALILEDLRAKGVVDYRLIFHPKTGPLKKPLCSFERAPTLQRKLGVVSSDDTFKVWRNIICLRSDLDINCTFGPEECCDSLDFLHNAVAVIVKSKGLELQFLEEEGSVLESLTNKSLVILDQSMHKGLFRLFYESVGKARYIQHVPQEYQKAMDLLTESVSSGKSLKPLWDLIKEKSQSRPQGTSEFFLYFLVTAYKIAGRIDQEDSRGQEPVFERPRPFATFKKMLISDQREYIKSLPVWAQNVFDPKWRHCPLECLAQITMLQAHFSSFEECYIYGDADWRVMGDRKKAGYLQCFNTPLEVLIELAGKIDEELLQPAFEEIFEGIPKDIRGTDRWLWLFCQTYGTEKAIKIGDHKQILKYLPIFAKLQRMQSRVEKIGPDVLPVAKLFKEVGDWAGQMIPTPYKRLLDANPLLLPELICLLPTYQAALPEPSLNLAKDALIKGSPDWLVAFYQNYPMQANEIAKLLLKDRPACDFSIEFIKNIIKTDQNLALDCLAACFTADTKEWRHLILDLLKNETIFGIALDEIWTIILQNPRSNVFTTLFKIYRPINKLGIESIAKWRDLVLDECRRFCQESSAQFNIERDKALLSSFYQDIAPCLSPMETFNKPVIDSRSAKVKYFLQFEGVAKWACAEDLSLYQQRISQYIPKQTCLEMLAREEILDHKDLLTAILRALGSDEIGLGNVWENLKKKNNPIDIFYALSCLHKSVTEIKLGSASLIAKWRELVKEESRNLCETLSKSSNTKIARGSLASFYKHIVPCLTNKLDQKSFHWLSNIQPFHQAVDVDKESKISHFLRFEGLLKWSCDHNPNDYARAMYAYTEKWKLIYDCINEPCNPYKLLVLWKCLECLGICCQSSEINIDKLEVEIAKLRQSDKYSFTEKNLPKNALILCLLDWLLLGSKADSGMVNSFVRRMREEDRGFKEPMDRDFLMNFFVPMAVSSELLYISAYALWEMMKIDPSTEAVDRKKYFSLINDLFLKLKDSLGVWYRSDSDPCVRAFLKEAYNRFLENQTLMGQKKNPDSEQGKLVNQLDAGLLIHAHRKDYYRFGTLAAFAIYLLGIQWTLIGTFGLIGFFVIDDLTLRNGLAARFSEIFQSKLKQQVIVVS